jgi:hypothetical protein
MFGMVPDPAEVLELLAVEPSAEQARLFIDHQERRRDHPGGVLRFLQGLPIDGLGRD